MTTSPALISVAEAAERLGIGRSTVYELLGRGVLRSVKIGRSRLIPTDAIEEFIDSLTAGDTTGERHDG